MKNIFKPGDTKVYNKIVTEKDVVAFEGVKVHDVYATFALARDMEWSSRLFVLDLKEEDEEGIGTALKIIHKGPALVGEKVEITATVKLIQGNELICDIIAKVRTRVVAEGKTGQKVLKKEKIDAIFNTLKRNIDMIC